MSPDSVNDLKLEALQKVHRNRSRRQHSISVNGFSFLLQSIELVDSKWAVPANVSHRNKALWEGNIRTQRHLEGLPIQSPFFFLPHAKQAERENIFVIDKDQKTSFPDWSLELPTHTQNSPGWTVIFLRKAKVSQLMQQRVFCLYSNQRSEIKTSTCAENCILLISKSWRWRMPKNPLAVLKADLWGDFFISVLTALRKSLGKPIRELYKIIFW